MFNYLPIQLIAIMVDGTALNFIFELVYYGPYFDVYILFLGAKYGKLLCL